MDTQIWLPWHYKLVNLQTAFMLFAWNDLRLASSRQADHNNGNTTRVEKTTTHCAVKLGRSHVLIVGDIVDAINES